MNRTYHLAAVALLASPLAVHAKSAADVAANALPTGFELRSGNADSPVTVGNQMTVTQHGQRVVYGWKGFDVGTAATVIFGQNPGDMALNIVVGNDPSYILGTLKAPGTVFFVNPNGMYFGSGASINVGGMLATTMDMDSDEFMKGRYRLTKAGGGIIRNEARIDAGSVVFVADTVENAGSIYATTVTLAAGSAVAIDVTGDGLIRARVENPALKARIENSGTITARLAVALTAGQARDTLDRVVNNTGVIRATGLAERGGDIVLEGGLVTNSGTLDASSATGTGGGIDLLGRNVLLGSKSMLDASGTSGGTVKVIGDMKAGRVDVDGAIRATGIRGDGGFIETSAAEVRILDGFRINALSAYGHAGKWLIDPVDFYITAGSGSLTTSGIGATTLSNALGGASVTIATDAATGGNGDIFVNSAVSWGANTVLTLSAHRNILVNADISATGDGAGLKLYYGGTDGITAPAANTGYSLNNGASITLSGAIPILWIGNRQYVVINSLAALQAMNGNLNGNYALGSDVDASATAGWNSGAGFAPIGNSTTSFAGTFDGLGHKISGLTINRTSMDYVGLFGYNTGRLINVALAGGTVRGYYWVGALAGANEGYIGNTSSSAAVVGDRYVGGLVGMNAGWTPGAAVIAKSYATGSVTSSSTGNSGSMGGLVGENGAWYAPAYGYISESYATGNVKYSGGGAYWALGGLAGTNYGVIDDSYATGAVANYAVNGWVGGFVGLNSKNNAAWGGSISGSWSAGGAVYGGMSFGTNIGPFVGENTGTVSNSYWDKSLNCCGANGYGTNSGTIANLVGLTTAQFLDPANLANLGFSGGLNNSVKWWMAPGYTRPFLRSEWTTYIANAHQLQLMGMDPSANYALRQDIDLAAALKPTDLLIPSGGGNYVQAGSMWNGWTGWDPGVGPVTSASFAPVGDGATPFSGSLNGQGHTISNLYIAGCIGPCVGTPTYIGLFGKTSSTAIIRNLGLVNAIIDTGNNWPLDDLGLLAGWNDGQVLNSHATGTIGNNAYTSQSSHVGGLVGYNNGSIANSYAAVTVYGSDSVGGLAGWNTAVGTISDSHATGNVTGSGVGAGGLVGQSTGTISRGYATGNVTGGFIVGGLVGYNFLATAQITDSYATGSVTGTSAVGYTGGLVGYNTGAIATSYATGLTSAVNQTYIGGLTGSNNGATASIQNSFWNKDTSCGAPPCNSGIGPGGGGAVATNSGGLSAAEMKTMAKFTGWDISTAASGSSKWVIDEGVSYPVLRVPSVSSPPAVTPAASSPTTSTVAASTSGDPASSITAVTGISAVTVAAVLAPSTSRSGGTSTDGKPTAAIFGSPATTTPVASAAKADDVVTQPDRPKGRMLVCRKG